MTVVNTEAPHSMTENIQTDPDGIVTTFASCMATLGVNNLYSQGTPVLVLGIEHAQHIAAAGWSKQELQRALFERARQPWGLMKNRGKSKGPRFPEFVDRSDDNSMVPIVREPERSHRDRRRRRRREVDVPADRGRAEPRRVESDRNRVKEQRHLKK